MTLIVYTRASLVTAAGGGASLRVSRDAASGVVSDDELTRRRNLSGRATALAETAAAEPPSTAQSADGLSNGRQREASLG